jgi:predicted Zn-dependent peptidase
VEPEERGGISHLIEHLVFKGTATRSAEAIARAIDSVGGHMDAFTAKEHTCFYVGVLDEHLPLAVDLLSDILMRPLFSADDIEKEKAVVLQEIKMVEDTPDDLIHDIFAEQVWAGHPLGRPAAAREGAPPRLRPVVHMASKPLEQVHMVLGFPGIADVAPERYALYLLNDVIGGSMSSRLFQEVRERQALVYSVHSGTQGYRDTGILYVYAGTEPANFGKVLKAVLKEIRGLKKDGVTPEELRRAKDHLKGNLMLSLESTSSRMNRLAKQEMRFGSFLTLDEMLAAFDAVRPEDVEALLHRVLDEEQLALVTLGPVDKRNLPRDTFAR